ncbi:MAG: hypothetical protein RLZZ33_824 [Pseudomonadota bacterium]|jgi:uncharacterized iron-regulated membrane protein
MRRFVFKIHVWVGLVAGLHIVLLGLSGSALVFRADIERWQVSNWLTVQLRDERFSLDEAVAHALREYPARELSKVLVPATAHESIEVVLQLRNPPTLKAADLISVYVDPYSLRILGERRRAAGIMWYLQDFHYALLAGELGLKINGIAALALLALALSGPVLWWPGSGRWRSALNIRRQPAAARWRDIHGASGIISWLAIMLITLTGLYFAFRGTATAVLTLASGAASVTPPAVLYHPATESSRDAPLTFAPLSVMLQNAREAEPTARFDELRPARTLQRPASLSFRLPGDNVPGRHRMFLDPTTGTVLRVDRFDSLDAGGRLFASMVPWHFGSFGGRLTQWLWFLVGLIPAMLLGSGLWLWLRKRHSGLVNSPATPSPDAHL